MPLHFDSFEALQAVQAQWGARLGIDPDIPADPEPLTDAPLVSSHPVACWLQLAYCHTGTPVVTRRAADDYVIAVQPGLLVRVICQPTTTRLQVAAAGRVLPTVDASPLPDDLFSHLVSLVQD